MVLDVHFKPSLSPFLSCMSVVKQKSAFAPVLKLQSSTAEASGVPICTVMAHDMHVFTHKLFSSTQYYLRDCDCAYTHE